MPIIHVGDRVIDAVEVLIGQRKLLIGPTDTAEPIREKICSRLHLVYKRFEKSDPKIQRRFLRSSDRL